MLFHFRDRGGAELINAWMKHETRVVVSFRLPRLWQIYRACSCSSAGDKSVGLLWVQGPSWATADLGHGGAVPRSGRTLSDGQDTMRPGGSAGRS